MDEGLTTLWVGVVPSVLVVCGGATTADAARDAGLAIAGVASSPSATAVAGEVARVLWQMSQT